MKVIIPLAGYGKRMRPHTWSRAKPLLNVSGNTVIGHLLDQMEEVTKEEVIFVVGYKGDELETWIRQHYPHLDAYFVTQEEPLGQAHAIWLCRDFMDENEILIAFGDGIVKADYLSIPDPNADAVCLVQEVDDPRTFGVAVTNNEGFITHFIEKPMTTEHKSAVAGIYWFRHGNVLRQALEKTIEEGRKTKGEFYLVDTYRVLLEQGVKILPKPTIFWLDAGKPDFMLTTNAQLLALGYGTENAIELSYAGDFTVLPPVFIHDSANITGSVIGPYANIEANVTIKDSIVRNSIIDAGTQIENCVLDGAIIGENCKVNGQSKALFIGDNSIVELG